MPAAARRARPSTVGRGYGGAHQTERKRLNKLVLAGDVQCVRCGGIIQEGEPWDLGHFDDGSPGWAGPEHARCNRGAPSRLRRPRPWMPQPKLERQPEREGLHPDDPVWDVPWLKGLRRVPKQATWPRLMTVPHPKAVNSLGREFVRWSEARSGGKLRWWQRLVATRLLEVDKNGRLCWATLLLTVARQVGKSWLLRELILWRIHQGDRFGEPQNVLHTGKNLAICKDVQRPSRYWAKSRPEYKVREVNGQEEIELKADGSRWMLRAQKAVEGYSVSVGAVDEAWKVTPGAVEEGLTPTMVEREQPQLWLISTAHRLATDLMRVRRRVALAELESGVGDLLIEWSAPASMDIDDVDAWRQASPHWTKQRETLVGQQLRILRAGELDSDEEEEDPEQFFRSQWLNQWPDKRTPPSDQVTDLLPEGLWAECAQPLLVSDGPIWVAVEDDFGLGAAVAAAVLHDDGRIELDGWLCPDWDSALADVKRLGSSRRIRQLLVGASLLNRVPAGTTPPPAPAGGRETRPGLALLRDLAANGRLVHDENTGELDQAFNLAQVREQPTGLYLTSRGPTHLVRAAVWAVHAAHRPTPLPAIA